MKPLFLYEEVLLLALRDEEGSVHFGVHYPFALGAAIIAEFILSGRAQVKHEKRKKFLEVKKHGRFHDELLDEMFTKLKNAKRRQQLQTWVRRVSNTPGLKHKAAKSLCRKGILRLEESKVLLVFKRKLYPEINPKPEKELIDRLRSAIFSTDMNIEPRTLVQIAICNSTGLLKPLFGKKEIKAQKKRIEQIVEGEMIGEAARNAVEAMQAAVMVATIIPAVSVAATS